MKVLILVTDYPDLKGNIPLFYIHTRSKYYLENGISLEVLNFKAKEDYVIDGINVITLKSFKDKKKEYDLLISHAPNLRNHYIFIKKYGKRFSKHLFFFHGHEVLKINKDYSKPYDYIKTKNKTFQNIYDFIKLKIWHFHFKYNIEKTYFIFVSNWMKEMFLKNVKIKEAFIEKNAFITYNSIGADFEKKDYEITSKKEYDFITIRGNLDGSKYCIDIVNKLAYQNPKSKFLIVGKGIYFNFNKKAPNVKWINGTLSHNEIISLLNKSKCALMPTRTDAQGLMMCEMATFGIPLITSNISVCYEVFNSFKNVEFIDNNNIEKEDIVKKYNTILKRKKIKKNTKYFLANNCNNEIKIIKNIIIKNN